MRIVVDRAGLVLMWSERGRPAPPDGGRIVELTSAQSEAFLSTPNTRGLAFEGEAFPALPALPSPELEQALTRAAPGGGPMIAVLIRPEYVVRAWRDLGPMLQAAQATDQPDARQLVFDGNAQLWAILDRYEPIAAVVTQIKPDGRCLLWQIAGTRVREWAAMFVTTVTVWARSTGCWALYGCGRKGWKGIVEPMGFERVADIDGRPAWQFTIGGANA